MVPSLADTTSTVLLLKEPLLNEEEGESKTELKEKKITDIIISFSPASISRNGVLRILFHIYVLITLLFYSELTKLAKPSLGLEFPVIYFSIIGYGVPWEFFTGSSVLLLGVLPRFVGPNAIYNILLLLTTFMTLAVGLLKFRQMLELQNEFEIKMKYEDEDEEDIMDPVKPGPELDALRLIEKKDIRQRKQAQKNAKDENRRSAFAYAGIPSESVYVVV